MSSGRRLLRNFGLPAGPSITFGMTLLSRCLFFPDDLKQTGLRDYIRLIHLLDLKNRGPEVLAKRSSGIGWTITLGRQQTRFSRL